MTTKAIDAGALAIAELRGAIWTRDKSKPVSATFDHDAAKACIEAALASGELVPASAVAAERERCAQLCDEMGAREQYNHGLDRAAQNYFRARNAIRALEPASGLGLADQLAAERERCAKVVDEFKKYSGYGCEDDNDLVGMFGRGNRFAKRKLAKTIRALEPASGEYVLVPRETLLNAQRYAWLRDKNACVLEECGSELDELCDDGMNREMLTAATSNGGGK